jgi:hypothetical protein
MILPKAVHELRSGVRSALTVLNSPVGRPESPTVRQIQQAFRDLNELEPLLRKASPALYGAMEPDIRQARRGIGVLRS